MAVSAFASKAFDQVEAIRKRAAVNEMKTHEIEQLQEVIEQQGSRMSQMRWALERILDAAEGSSSLTWSGVADVARRALTRDASAGA